MEDRWVHMGHYLGSLLAECVLDASEGQSRDAAEMAGLYRQLDEPPEMFHAALSKP